METFGVWRGLAQVWDRLGAPFISLGGTAFSAFDFLKVTLAVAGVVLAARIIRRELSTQVLPRLGVERGLAYAVSNIFFYVFAAIGTLVVLQSSGITLTTLTVLLGAVGVGIGFGLQEVASNFICGLIILLERPIEVGNRIQLGELDGQVTRINIRATEVLTNDSIAVIVPNKDLITLRVVNWSRGGDSIRVHIPIGVAYGTDPQLVRRALLECAAAVPEVLADPAPEVRMLGFGDSSVNFELLAWTRDLLQQRPALVSRVNFAIEAIFRRDGIQIPFPQRQLHLENALPVTLVAEDVRRFKSGADR